MKALIPLLLIALAAPLAAQERERIAAERADVEARFATQQRECESQFIVASCIDTAQAVRREALAKLRKQELALNQAERKQKAAERSAEIRAKENAPPPPAKPVPMPPAAEPGKTGSEPPSARIRQPKPVPPQPSAEELAANRARYEQRQIDAQKHREEVARRNQERAAQKKPSVPLPVPPASGATP